AGPARDPHAGHATPATPAKEGTQAKVMDPVNGLMVDPATASKATYQGQTYYFSSEQTRKEFLQNPAKFAKKPKQ
ncbi:MAG: YHS domain-containing protein, partial [bacterium]